MAGTSSGVKGIASYGDYLFTVCANRFHVFKNGVLLGAYTSAAFTKDQYNVTTYFIGDLYAIVTDPSGAEDLVWLKISLSPISITDITGSVLGLTNKKTVASGFYKGRVLIAGNASNPGNLYYSKSTTANTPSDSYDFSGTGSGAKVVGDGSQRITGFVTRQDVGYVICDRSVWKITDDDATTGPSIVKETSTGCIRQSAVCEVLQDVFYFDGTSVRRLSYEENNTALKDVAISDEVRNTILQLPRSQEKAVSYFAYPYYKLHLRTYDSSVNNIAFVYQVETKSWAIQSGISAN